MSVPTRDSAVPELRDAHESAQLVPYLRELWARRTYIWYVAKSELRRRQITTVLGNLWHLLNPALSIAVYFIIFGLLLETDRGVGNFLLFLTVGISIFQFTQRATVDGAKSIVANLGLLKAIKFPRAMLPITSTVTEVLSAISSFVVLYAVAVITGEAFRLSWFLLPLVVAVQLVFNLGAAMMAARATTHFRDIQQILPFVFRLLFYGSGVIFSVDAYAEGGRIASLFVLNPMYCFITVARWCMFGGDLDPWLLVSGLVWTVGVLVVGFLWFRAGEEQYARD